MAAAAGVPPLVAHLLLLRGVCTPEAAKAFLSPSLQHLSDPFLLADMDVAVARLARAKAAREPVLIFGDYDVDGISGAAVLSNGLKRFGLDQFCCAMPQRLTDGYGMNREHVEEASAQGIRLIITVDNGIAAHEAISHARKLGIDVIVTDHHAIENDLPPALAVINPKRQPADYAGRHLSGAGVAFKLSCALNGTANDLDIAALGTVADIVPLLEENRVIVALGLRHMALHKRTGIAKLAAAAGIDLAEVTSENIGYQLGPRINAAGRLDDGRRALELLLTDCPLMAGEMAAELESANAERRLIENEIYHQALEEAEALFHPAQRSIVVARRGWHAGVIGIVASRLQRRFSRPTIVIAIDDDGVGRGSARGGPGFNLVEGLAACVERLIRYGGHKSAAGLSLREDKVDDFRVDFEVEARRQLGGGELACELSIDALASLTELDPVLLTALKKLEPLGQENPAPVFCTLGVELLPDSVRILKEQHLRFTVKKDGAAFSAIGFGMAERFYQQNLQQPLDIAYIPQFNTWRGNTSIQLNVQDLRLAER